MMNEIIKQIAQIDSVAVNNRKISEQILKAKREQYEKDMATYREETMQKAQQKAEELYQCIISSESSSRVEEENQYRRLAELTQNHYQEIEEWLLNTIFKELFGVEG